MCSFSRRPGLALRRRRSSVRKTIFWAVAGLVLGWICYSIAPVPSSLMFLLRGECPMKLIIALAAAGLVSVTVIIPANAQFQRKDPVCLEKCNRAGGERGIVVSCIAACPPLKLGSADLKKRAASNNPNDPNWVNRSGGWNRGGCRRYAMVNNCQVRYDTRDFQCKCI
jgi:hypothetical protein